MNGARAGLGASAEALARRERGRAGLNTAAGGVSAAGAVVAAIPVVPWTQIAGGSLIVVGSALKLAAALRERGSRALAGDESAVAGFARSAARWSSARRARVAKRLAAMLKRRGRGKRDTARSAILRLKLKVLYAIEAGSRAEASRPGDRQRPVVADVAGSEPVAVAANPLADVDQPGDVEGQAWKYWLGAGVVVAAGVLLLSPRSSRNAAERAPSRAPRAA